MEGAFTWATEEGGSQLRAKGEMFMPGAQTGRSWELDRMVENKEMCSRGLHVGADAECVPRISPLGAPGATLPSRRTRAVHFFFCRGKTIEKGEVSRQSLWRRGENIPHAPHGDCIDGWPGVEDEFGSAGGAGGAAGRREGGRAGQEMVVVLAGRQLAGWLAGGWPPVGKGRQSCTDGGGDGVWPRAETLGGKECGVHVGRRHDSIAPDPFLEIRSSQRQRAKQTQATQCTDFGAGCASETNPRLSCAQLCATALRQNVHSPHLDRVDTYLSQSIARGTTSDYITQSRQNEYETRVD